MEARDFSIKTVQITATVDYTEVLFVPSTEVYWVNRHDCVIATFSTEAEAVNEFNYQIGALDKRTGTTPAPLKLPVITSKAHAEDLSALVLSGLRVGCSITIAGYTITAQADLSYAVRSIESGDCQDYRSIWMILWANRKAVNALVKSGALDCFLPQEEQAPAPVPEVPTGCFEQVPYDWQAWQEEQDQINGTASAIDPLQDTLEFSWHQWQPAPAPQALIPLSYAMPTGTGTAKLPAPFQVPDYFRLIDWQEEPSAIERLQVALEAFEDWQEERLSIFASPAICACSYIGVLFMLLYTIVNR